MIRIGSDTDISMNFNPILSPGLVLVSDRIHPNESGPTFQFKMSNPNETEQKLYHITK